MHPMPPAPPCACSHDETTHLHSARYCQLPTCLCGAYGPSDRDVAQHIEDTAVAALRKRSFPARLLGRGAGRAIMAAVRPLIEAHVLREALETARSPGHPGMGLNQDGSSDPMGEAFCEGVGDGMGIVETHRPAAADSLDLDWTAQRAFTSLPPGTSTVERTREALATVRPVLRRDLLLRLAVSIGDEHTRALQYFSGSTTPSTDAYVQGIQASMKAVVDSIGGDAVLAALVAGRAAGRSTNA